MRESFDDIRAEVSAFLLDIHRDVQRQAGSGRGQLPAPVDLEHGVTPELWLHRLFTLPLLFLCWKGYELLEVQFGFDSVGRDTAWVFLVIALILARELLVATVVRCVELVLARRKRRSGFHEIPSGSKTSRLRRIK
jgi:hypothetical protein